MQLPRMLPARMGVYHTRLAERLLYKLLGACTGKQVLLLGLDFPQGPAGYVRGTPKNLGTPAPSWRLAFLPLSHHSKWHHLMYYCEHQLQAAPP